MLALLDDQLGQGRTPLRIQLSLLAHGMAERIRAFNSPAVVGSRDARWRNGALVVLVAWAAFVVGGAGFAKASEHFDQAVPTGSALVPRLAVTIVAIGAICGGLTVLAGGALATPALVAHLRASGWRTFKRPFLRAVSVSVATVSATEPLVTWAHQLNDAQRNGADAGYSVAFAAWVLFGTATLGCWTAVAVAIGRHVELSRSILRVQAALATALTATMLVITIAAVVWWAAIATAAPGFLYGTPSGTGGLPFNLPLTVAVLVMTAATTLGIAGALRMHHTPRSCTRA